MFGKFKTKEQQRLYDYDIVIVGAGIIGATLAKEAQRQGKSFVMLDDFRENSGTWPSGGHLKPSWFGVPSEVYTPALAVIDRCWGLINEKAKLALGPLTIPKEIDMQRIDIDKMLAWRTANAVKREVTEVFCEGKTVTTADGHLYKGKLVVVAAGVWCHALFEQGQELAKVVVQGKTGVSFRATGEIPSMLIKPWAPYKQIVAHQQRATEIWVGDGSALLYDKWSDSRTSECWQRCRQALGVLGEPIQMRLGYRPYADFKKGTELCLLKQVHDGVWVATGAGKNGTIAAGWVAERLLG